MAQLQAVFLDIDDTLYPTSEFTAMARRKAVQAMIAAGLRTEEEVAFRELSELVREFSSNDSHHYDRLLLRLPPAAVVGVNVPLVVASGVAAYHDAKFRSLAPYPDAVEAIPLLARIDGVRLGVLTSGVPSKQAEKLVRLKVAGYIDPAAFFVAENLGYSKVNPKFYQTVARRLNLDPGRCLHIGDKLEADVVSARSAGYQTILMKRPGKPEPTAAPGSTSATGSCGWTGAAAQPEQLGALGAREARSASESSRVRSASPDHICCNFQEVLWTLKKQYGMVPRESSHAVE
ncbi:MAG: HAD family hydrolase [Planctomycetota bacterium]